MGAFGQKGFSRRSGLALEAASSADLTGTAYATTSEVVAEGDLLMMTYRGKVRVLRTMDLTVRSTIGDNSVNANAVQSTAIGSAVRTEAGRNPPLHNTRLGNVIYAASATATGLSVYRTRFTSSGIVQSASVAVNLGGAQATAIRMFWLSDGKIAVVACSGTNCYRVVLDEDLNVVTPVAVVSALVSGISTSMDAIPLAAGGFAVTYLATGNVWSLRIYDNAGVSAATLNVLNLSGGANNAALKAAQLSDGNIALTAASSFTVTQGLYHAIATSAGVQVLAATNLNTTVAAALTPAEIGVCSGYYHVGYINDATVYVRTNAGAPQSTYALSLPKSGDARAKFATDGTYSYFLWQDTAHLFYVTRTSLAGASPTTIKPVGSATFEGGWDAFFDPVEQVLCVQVQQGVGLGSLGMFVVDTLRMVNANTASGVLGNGSTQSSGSFCGIVNLGDACFAFVYDSPAVGGTYLGAIRFLSGAPLGVSKAAAAKGASVPVATGPGIFSINPVLGSAASTFDCTTASSPAPGNKGTITTHAAFLKGMV